MKLLAALAGTCALATAALAATPAPPGDDVGPYEAYAVRGQVVNGLNMATAIKKVVVDYYAANGKWPASIAETGFAGPMSGKFVRNLSVDRGTIAIHFGNEANAVISGRFATQRPSVGSDGKVVWGCGYTRTPGADPRSGASGPHRTNLHARFLPESCRG